MIAALELEEHVIIPGYKANPASRHIGKVLQITSSHSQAKAREQGQGLKQQWNSTQRHEAGTLRF